MRKIYFLFLLLPLLCCGRAWAEDADLEARARSGLTEVYGYTEEETGAFVFEPCGQYALAYYDPLHPEWTYLIRPDLKWGGLEDLSPFQLFQTGEKAVRELLREAAEKDWFRHWSKPGRQALIDAMRARGLSPDAELETESISAAQAVHLFFVSAYGDSYLWSPAILQWRNEALKQNGLSVDDVEEYPTGSGEGAAFLQAILPDPDYADTSIVYFEGLPPLALREALRDSRLQGWRLISGSMVQSTRSIGSNYASSLMLFEKDGERLLLLATRDDPQGPWALTPADDKCLLPGRTPRIYYQRSSPYFARGFAICYADPGQPSFTFLVRPYQPSVRATPLCCIICCAMYDEATQTGWRWESGRLVTYLKNGVQEADSSVPSFPFCLDQLDGDTFPRTADEVRAYAGKSAPAGYGVISSSVHLRAQTSSRSGDLGMFNQGTLIQVEATLPGDPSPWYQVKCGRIGGYVVKNYAQYPADEAALLPLHTYFPLPVARASQNIYLKRDTGLLSPSVTELPAGSEMHVLLETGGWLYVAVPRGEMDWYMDVNGIYGFVRASEVTQYATLSALRWDAQKK